MRRPIAITAAAVLVAAMLSPGSASAGPGSGEGAEARKAALRALAGSISKPAAPGKAPTGVNPYLALLPDPTKADYIGWQKWMNAQGDQRAAQRAQQRAAAAAPLLADEEEPTGVRGGNDTPANAQRISGFGTGNNQNHLLRVLGTLSPERVELTNLEPNTEDDGAIPLARETGVGATEAGVTTSGQIGDGPHGSAGAGTGDFDFYEVTGVTGETLTVDIDTAADSGLDSIVLLFDAEGGLVAANDDTASGFDSLLVHQFTADGAYFVAVVGWPSVPEDPFDPASGLGVGTEGPYNVAIHTGEQDTDFFAVQLRPGDVLGASVEGSAGRITIYDTDRREVHGSAQDASSLYPANSPLPGGGNAVTEHVADKAGWHYVGVSGGDGTYDITVEAYRPALEGQRPKQTLFLDFDGARINTAIFGGPGVRTLSPLRAFLGRWGLTADDEDALIDAVVAGVEENLRHDLAESGLNRRFDLRILNSRDHADPFGQPNVSRVIVGGTIDESQIPTIGIAQTIDPGNFGTEESALVLLDLLSDPAGEDTSLNTYLTEASDKIAFVGRALGNVTSHEAGHFFGDWHVDQFNEQANIMDQGGNFPVMFAVGPDNVGGTADDPDVDFGEDVFNPNEGSTGIEDTLTRLSFALTR
ncbi:PPC domain-containing protein [Plantactinospora sp. CA-290183]|uniref:PPC domain-containing protein n=1 Tax=Plantactinospora sp. CA-290183 TaxID=3240006 RepID=UPI003D8FE10F